MVDQSPLGVEADELAPRPETGIEGEDPLLTEGRRQEELAEIVGEDPDRLRIGPLFGHHADLRFHRAGQEPPVRVFDGQPDLFGERTISLDKEGAEQRNRFRLGRDDAESEKFFLLAPAHREYPVRGDFGRRLFPVEVVQIAIPFLLLARDYFRLKDGFVRKECPHPGAGLFVFVHPFGDDVPGAGQGVFRGRHSLFGIDESRCLGERIERLLLGKDALGEGFEPLLPGRDCPRPTLGTEGEIEILEDGEGFRGIDPALQFVGKKFALCE